MCVRVRVHAPKNTRKYIKKKFHLLKKHPPPKKLSNLRACKLSALPLSYNFDCSTEPLPVTPAKGRDHHMHDFFPYSPLRNRLPFAESMVTIIITPTTLRCKK